MDDVAAKRFEAGKAVLKAIVHAGTNHLKAVHEHRINLDFTMLGLVQHECGCCMSLRSWSDWKTDDPLFTRTAALIAGTLDPLPSGSGLVAFCLLAQGCLSDETDQLRLFWYAMELPNGLTAAGHFDCVPDGLVDVPSDDPSQHILHLQAITLNSLNRVRAREFRALKHGKGGAK